MGPQLDALWVLRQVPCLACHSLREPFASACALRQCDGPDEERSADTVRINAAIKERLNQTFDLVGFLGYAIPG